MITLFEDFMNFQQLNIAANALAKQFAKKHGLVINDEPDYSIREGDDGEYYGVCDEGMFIAQYQINNMFPFSLFIVPENKTIGISNGDGCMFKIEENEIQLSEEDFQSCMYDMLEWDKFDNLSKLLESDNI